MFRISLGAFRLYRSFRKSINPFRVNGSKFVRSKLSLPALGLATVACTEQQEGWSTMQGLATMREQLQHQFLLRQACTANTNTATQLLTLLAIAYHDTSNRLREALLEEIKLTDQLIQWGDNTPEQHFDNMIAHRVTLENLRQEVRVLYSYLEYVEKLATASAELSYITGNTIASDMICEQIQLAKHIIKQECDSTDIIQNQCLRLQSKVIETSGTGEDDASENV